MRKQEKIDMYTKKFMEKGVSREEAVEEAMKLIPYGQEDYLTIEQLKIKFNYSDMDGQYPNWITPEQHLEICTSTAKSEYSFKKYGWFCTQEELISKLYIWSRIRLNRFNSHNHLRAGLKNACKNILRDVITKETKKGTVRTNQDKYFNRVNGESYICGSLDNVVSRDGDTVTTFGDIIASPDNQKGESEIDMIHRIESVKNKEVRELLVVCGYLLAGMEGLHDKYLEVVQNCTPEIGLRLQQIQEAVYLSETITNYRQSGIKVGREVKKPNITFKDIIKAFGCDYFKVTPPNRKGEYRAPSLKSAISDLQEYIDINLFDGVQTL